MPKMIDPSTLEGDDLTDWYLRSPDDVEAEREAAWQAKYDAFVKSIGAASGSPQDSTGHSRQDDSAFAGLVKVGYEPPAPAVLAPPEVEPMMEPPSGPRVGPMTDTRGVPPAGAAGPGFFSTYRDRFEPTQSAYFTDLPSPLNKVTVDATHWAELSDQTRVPFAEVERIYAEQQRRLKGQDKSEPQSANRLHVVNKWADGQIPKAEQVAVNERELDPTCSPYGGWERDLGYATNSDLSKLYQTQISRAPGLEYVVRVPGKRGVRFDGCAVWDPKHPLLEAKGPRYAPLIANARKSKSQFFFNNMFEKDVDQAARQAAVAAPDQQVEWHVAEPAAFSYFKEATERKRPPIVVQVTPPKW